MLQDAYYDGCQTACRLWQIKHPFTCNIDEDDERHVRCCRRSMARYVSAKTGKTVYFCKRLHLMRYLC